MINCIVCTDKNWGIGKKNDLLFHLKKDMSFFRETTNHTFVCMGENTLLSFPNSKPLKNKVNVVLCPEGHEYENCICIHNFEDMVKFVKNVAKEFPVFIIGGAMFYKSMLPYCDRVYVTKVEATDSEATAFFPNLDENSKFKVYEESELQEENGLSFKFVFYQKVK